MNKKLRILVLEDAPTDTELIERELRREQIEFSLKCVETEEDFLKELGDFAPDLILSDYSLPSFDGISALERAKERCPDVPFIFVTGSLGEEMAIETLKRGATDYILKDRLSRLAPAVSRALREAEERKRHRQALEALRDSRALLAGIVDSAMDAIISVDSEQRIILFNNAAEKVFRCSASEVIGQPIDRFIPEQFRAVHREHINRFAQTGITSRTMGELGPLFGLRSDGEDFPVEASISQVEALGRKVFTVILRDITERKRAEEKIREQAELLDKSQDAIFVRDLEQRIIYWNRSAERLYGWTADEIMGKNANDILYKKEGLPQIIQVQKRVIEEGEWTGELNQVTKDGREIIVEGRVTLVRDDEGRPKSILAVNTDITEKKRLEAQFLRAQRMESIGTLAGGIAHDLNNVLHPITMALQLLRGKLTDEQSQKWIDTLEASAERGANLVKQILSFARGTEGERTVIQVRYIISEIERIIRETFPRSIGIRTDVTKDLWDILGDVTQINQVLMNICVNARDAMPNGGTLSISAGNTLIDEHYASVKIGIKVGPYVVVSISDTGIGIPPALLDRIFEPFFTTKEVGKGTGLGLSTAFGIVKGHGGFIDVYSEVGKGATFKVYLPAIETMEIQKTKAKEIENLPLGHGELILLVDDEASILEIARGTLESYGYRVVTADDGADAVALYVQNREEIKAVILDMMMPVMDGPACIRALRKIEPQVKIIAVSGLRGYSKLAEFSDLDVDALLSKPYTAETLIRTLHKVLGAE